MAVSFFRPPKWSPIWFAKTRHPHSHKPLQAPPSEAQVQGAQAPGRLCTPQLRLSGPGDKQVRGKGETFSPKLLKLEKYDET